MRYTDYDLQMARNFVAIAIDGVAIRFQFPPKIGSDSKSGSWDEQPSNVGWDPIATFKGASARTINMDWTYVVDGRDWTTTTISRQVRRLRRYFLAKLFEQGGESKLVAQIHLSGHGGVDFISCRFLSSDIKHSGPIINNEFHLRTDITSTIKIWANVGDQAQAVLNLDELTPDWY